MIGTGGGRTGEAGNDGDASELRFASAEAERENQDLRFELRMLALSTLRPLRMLMASDLSFVEALSKTPPLLCRLSRFAAIFGSIGMGGNSCAMKDFLDSASKFEDRLPFPRREGRLPGFGREGLRAAAAPPNSERGRSCIEDAPGDLLPLV